MKDSVSNPLLFWCIEQTKNYSFVNITNFTTSWKDGIAFCALLHKYFPDLIEISTLKAENAVKNLELAFFVAETKLDVPVLINPQSLVSEGSVDKELVVDYISKLYKAVTCKCQEQMWSNTSVDKQLSLLYDEEVALPLCCLCGQSIFRLEELTVFNKKYHRSCYRENQLNYLEERNRTLKVSIEYENLKAIDSSSAELSSDSLTTSTKVGSSVILIRPEQLSDCDSIEKDQRTQRAPSRPPLPDILNNYEYKKNGFTKKKANIETDRKPFETNDRLNPSQGPASYPDSLNPFADDSPCDSNDKLNCIQKPYNPFDDDELPPLDTKITDNVTLSSSNAVDSHDSPFSTTEADSNVHTHLSEKSNPDYSVECTVSDKSQNLLNTHSSICDLSSLLDYGCLYKPQSSYSVADHADGMHKKTTRSTTTKRPAPPIPVLCWREVRSDRRSDFVPYSELHRKLYEINNELSKLELQARSIQTRIKEMSGKDRNVKELLNQWLHTVQMKDNLFKKESELLQRLRCQELEDRHAELEYELRMLLAKQDILKTKEEKAREEELIADLIYIVDKRAELVESVENVKVKVRGRSSTRKSLENKFKKLCLTMSHASLLHKGSSAQNYSTRKDRKSRASSIFRFKNN